MRSCVYPGSFDPLTIGHRDIVIRSAKLFDKVYVAILNNSSKKNMFKFEERLNMTKDALTDIENVEVVYFDGLLINLLAKMNSNVIIRGIRTHADLEIEQQYATVNNDLNCEIETVLMIAQPKLQYISSTIVRELILYGADISKYVPKEIADLIAGSKL